MKYELLIPAKEIKAMMRFASVDESRLIINGIHFEYSKDNLLLIATDGRRLAVLKSEGECSSDVPAFTVPPALFEFVLWRIEREEWIGRMHVKIEVDDKTQSIAVSTDNYTLNGITLEKVLEPTGLYPKWRMVLPSDVLEPVEIQGIDAEFLTSFQNAAHDLTQCSKKPLLRFCGEKGAIGVVFDGLEQFYGVLMPIKFEAKPTRPAWLL